MSDFVKNTWYVAAWAKEIQPDTLLDRTIAGERLVFFRDAQGVVVALRNRCCHRSAPLSLGHRDGDGIRCGYHGLKFDGTGRCVDIPGQVVIPPGARVQSFPVSERYGMVWVWTGNKERANPDSITTMTDMDNANWNCVADYLHYDTNYQLIHDNLLDFSHVAYVHANTFGGTTKWAEEHPELKRLEDGFWFERWLPNIPPVPFVRSILGEDARQDLLQSYHFHVNGALTIDSRFQAAGSGTREKFSDIGFMHTYSWQAVTPETATSTHYFYSTALEKHWPMEILKVMQGGTTAAFLEDKKMIGAQQQELSKSPGHQIALMATSHDGPLNQMRAMIKRQIGAESLAEESA